jgi:hypothetical protein
VTKRPHESACVPIKLAENFRAVLGAPFYAAQTLGFHAREGVDVDGMDQVLHEPV